MTPLPRIFVLFLAASSALFTLTCAGAEKLKGEHSAYLRDHQGDLVDWMPWSDAVLTRAKTEKKPIYLFIGALTNELTRAMHRQSFANPQIAETLNRDFVCVLVDRDERVDLATLYQAYLQTNKQLNGWPANIWLTPEGKPFDGATYLPPSEEWGKEGVANVVKRIVAAWQASPEALELKAEEAVATTAAAEVSEPGPEFSLSKLGSMMSKASASWMEHYDAAHGGFGDSPRYPEPELLRFLLLTPGANRDAALATLHALDRGALHDPLDGGFFRRTIDAAWQFPSFQKTLGDQARLAFAFLDAASVTEDSTFSAAARTALDYGLTRLSGSTGGYIHGEDATPDELAAAYGWTQAEIETVLGEKDAAAFSAAYGAKAEGNVTAENDPGAKWKGKNLLFRVGPAADATSEKRLAEARAKLLATRDKRPRAIRDTNVLVGENALFLSALAEAGQRLKEPRYIEAARKLSEFFNEHARDAKSHSLLRLVGSATPAAAEDYVWLALGLSTPGAFQPANNAADQVRPLLHEANTRLLDLNTGHFFAQTKDGAPFWLRPHLLDPVAGELPSAEMVEIQAYLQLGAKTSEIPASLLRTVMAAADEPTGQPRGDVLLTAAKLSEAKP